MYGLRNSIAIDSNFEKLNNKIYECQIRIATLEKQIKDILSKSENKSNNNEIDCSIYIGKTVISSKGNVYMVVDYYQGAFTLYHKSKRYLHALITEDFFKQCKIVE